MFIYAYEDPKKRLPRDIEDWKETKKIDVFEIQKLLYKPTKEKRKEMEHSLTLSNKIGPTKNRIWDPNTIIKTHFFKDDYDEIQLDFLEFFKKEILTEKEYKEIKGILEEVYDKFEIDQLSSIVARDMLIIDHLKTKELKEIIEGKDSHKNLQVLLDLLFKNGQTDTYFALENLIRLVSKYRIVPYS